MSEIDVIDDPAISSMTQQPNKALLQNPEAAGSATNGATAQYKKKETGGAGGNKK